MIDQCATINRQLVGSCDDNSRSSECVLRMSKQFNTSSHDQYTVQSFDFLIRRGRRSDDLRPLRTSQHSIVFAHPNILLRTVSSRKLLDYRLRRSQASTRRTFYMTAPFCYAILQVSYSTVDWTSGATSSSLADVGRLKKQKWESRPPDSRVAVKRTL